ncbi:S-layer homology domain-containing protein [Chungangia koreensis]|uniref:S-layer homology domain-containing protein n=1 Tax=Chungangia koreensis TaxID=752657 RepID=A0ABV8X4N7_9LACT
MAYQPKSYKKFVATAATATLVASAIAPVASAASFSDVNDRYKEAVDYLAERGITEGYPNGKFGTNDPIKRQDAAKMIATALGATPDGDYPDKGFTDVPKSHLWAVNFLADKGIVSGKGAGKFASNEFMTRGEMAKVIANAYELVGNPDNEFPFTDVSDTFKKYVDALNEAGIAQGYENSTQFGTGDNVLRGQFALFVHRAETNVPAEVAVSSVTATNAKTLAVNFNKPVDTTKAAFTVKKGTVTTNVAKTTFSDDKKTAYLELSSKLTEGDYTVTVSGVAEKDLTGTYKAENEKVTDINLLSDKAIIDTTTSPDTVVVAYEVLNQYGENITKTTSLNAVSSLGVVSQNPTNGTLTIPLNNAKVGDKFTLSLVHVATGVSETATLTVSNEAQASEVDITSLYHETNKTLTADERNVTDYALVVDVKDQYGNSVSAAKARADLLVRVSDPTVVSVDGYNAGNATANFTTMKIDGEDVTVLKLAGGLKAGKSTVTLISKYTGKSDSYEITVNEGLKVNTLTLSQPELAVAGETVSIPFSATDMYGNAISSVNALNGGVTFSVSGTGSFAANGGDLDFEVNSKGQTVLNFDLPQDAQGNVTVTAITENQKVSTLTFDVKALAKPVAITGVKSTVYTSVLNSGDLTFKATDLIAEDQYGRTMSGAKLKNYLGNTASPVNGDYFVAVSEATNGGGAINLTGATRLGSTGDTATVVDSSARGTEGLNFALVQYNSGSYAPVVGSEFQQSVRVVEQSDIVSYDMEDVPALYDEAAAGTVEAADYNYEVEVFGLLSNGSKVFVPNNYYSVTTNHNALDYSGTELNVTSGDTISYGTATEVTLRATVTINNTGDVISKDVKVSKAKPVVAEVGYDAVTNSSKVSSTDNGFLIVATAADVNAASDHFGLLEVYDQYGAEAVIASNGIVTFADTTQTGVAATVTFSSIKDADGDNSLSVVSNGTSSANLSGLEVGDSFTTTITFANGQKTTANVIVK